jgi:hypothetical protein
MIIFSKVDGSYHGSTTSFENDWSDGGACGLSGFDSKKDLNQYLKENNYREKGTSELEILCWSKHTLQNGATLTCISKLNHKGKHSAIFSEFNKLNNRKYTWQ